MWKPCSLTLLEQQRAAGAVLAYCTLCLVTKSPCSSLNPETGGTMVKMNELDGMLYKPHTDVEFPEISITKRVFIINIIIIK